MNEAIFNYIKQARNAGLSDQQIQSNLLEVGWPQADIADGFNFLSATVKPAVSNIPVSNPRPVINAEQLLKNDVQDHGSPQMLSATTEAQLQSLPKENISRNFITKKIVLAGSVILLLVLVSLGVYVFYAKASPEAVWDRFTSLNSGYLFAPNQAEHLEYAIRYSDPNPNFKINVNIALQGDVDTRTSNPSGDADLSLSASLPQMNTDFSTKDIKFIYLNKVAYLNVSNLPLLSDETKDYNGWIKFDTTELTPEKLDEIKNYAAQALSKNSFNSLSDFEKQGIITHQYVGLEKVSGVYAYHYRLTINKNAFKQAIAANVKDVAGTLPGYLSDKTDGSSDYIKIINAFIDSIQINQSDIWVSVADAQPQKMNLNISMPSVYEIFNIVKNKVPSGTFKGTSDFTQQFVDAISQAAQDSKSTLDFQWTLSNLAGKFNLLAPNKSLDIIKQQQNQSLPLQ